MMMKMIKARLGIVLLAAALIGVSAFTARGGQVDWTISDEFLGLLHGKIQGEWYSIMEIYPLDVTIYLLPFTLEGEVRGGLNSSSTFNDSLAYDSFTFAWDYSGDAPSVGAVTEGGNFFLDPNADLEVFFLAFVRYAPGPGVNEHVGGFVISPGDFQSFFELERGGVNALGDWDPEWPINFPQTYIIIPEPTTGLLALIGAATLLLRRRRRE